MTSTPESFDASGRVNDPTSDSERATNRWRTGGEAGALAFPRPASPVSQAELVATGQAVLEAPGDHHLSFAVRYELPTGDPICLPGNHRRTPLTSDRWKPKIAPQQQLRRGQARAITRHRPVTRCCRPCGSGERSNSPNSQRPPRHRASCDLREVGSDLISRVARHCR